MTRKGIVAGSVALGIMAVVAAWFVSCCGRPEVRIRSSGDQEGRLIVDLRPDRRVNAIYRIRFWMEGDGRDEYRWVLERNETPIRRIVYGELPRGIRQKHPAQDVPPKQLPDQGTVYMEVEYQWDSLIPPAPIGDSTIVKLQLTEEGGVKLRRARVGPQEI